MTLIFIAFTIVLAFHCFLLLKLTLAWLKNKPLVQRNHLHYPKVTIVIVFNNEAKHLPALLESLNNQNYDKNYFEISFVNDHSTDNSVEIINNFKNNNNLNIQILNLGQYQNVSPKKIGITQAVNLSNASIIVCTDADCFFGANWLKVMTNFLEENNYYFVSGPVTFKTKNNWQKCLAYEFGSLIGVGASSIFLNEPNMCNGANLAFKKEVFNEISGYAGNENIISGDDEFLMHKINDAYSQKIGFVKLQEAIVTTEGPVNFKQFLQQRIRWASKWHSYKNFNSKFGAIFVFLIQCIQLLIFGMFILHSQLPCYLVIIFFVKNIQEILFNMLLYRFLQFKYLNFLNVLIVHLIYPFYVIIIGVLALNGKYTWKNKLVNFNEKI